MEKLKKMIFPAACVLSALLGITTGYLVFGRAGPVQAEARVYAAYTTDDLVLAALYPEYYEYRPDIPGPDTRSINRGTFTRSSPVEEPQELPTHRYVVTTQDGYIVVLHAEAYGGGVKEITSTAVGALAPEELTRLSDGIHIYSDEALARILQDYGS